MEHVECVRGDTAPRQLMRRNAEVAELELLALAHEDVERCEISMQCVTAMQPVERAENAGDLPSHEALSLRAALLQPRSKVAVLGVLHRQAVTGLAVVHFNKSIVHAKRP